MPRPSGGERRQQRRDPLRTPRVTRAEQDAARAIIDHLVTPLRDSFGADAFLADLPWLRSTVG